MQLFDYIFWTNQEKNNVNYVTTKIAMLFNVLQPVILALCIVLINKQKIKTESLVIFVIYMLCMSVYIITWWKDINYTLVTKESYPSLSWDWNSKVGYEFVYAIYLLLLISLFYQHFEYPINLFMVALTLISYIMAFPYFKNMSAGRFWCHYAGFLPIIIVLIYILHIVRP
jgi:hypothetical protein